MRTLVLSAGHNPRAKGARALGKHEYDLTCMVVSMLAEKLREEGLEVVTVDSTMGLAERCQWINENHKDALAFEIHFNAFNGKATGTEVFYKAGDKIGFDWGRSFLNGVASGLNLKSRGMKLATQSARGSLSWTSRLTHGVLWELCFMDNPDDMEKVSKDWNKTIEIIAEVIKSIPL